MDDPIEDINIADLAKEHIENQEQDSKQNVPGLRKSLIAWERLRKRKREDEIWRRQVAKIWDKHELSKKK
jgi:hypothetical protein